MPSDENVRSAGRIDFGSPTVQAVCLIAAFTVWRLIGAIFVGLGTDEAYTIAVARDLKLSYFDHPPMQYWISHFSSLVVGMGRADRLPFIALFAGTSWLMFVLTRRLFNAQAGVWACLALNLAGFFTVAVGSWVSPDGPLDFCLMAATVILAEGWFGREEPRPLSSGAWIAVGALIGVAALSKYQAALYAVGLPLFLLSSPSRRAELTRPGPYAAAVVTLAVLSPILVWNSQHDWASIAFQAGRGAPGRGFHPLGPLIALAGQAGVLLPWIFAPLAAQFVRATGLGPRDERRWFLLSLAAPTIAVITLAPLFGPSGLPHWSMSGWLMLFPLAGDRLSRSTIAGRSWPRTWAITGVAFLAIVGGALAADSETGFLAGLAPNLFHRGDLTVETLDWSAVRPELARRGLLGKPGEFVGAVKWSQAGKLDMALGDVMPIVVFSHDPRQYAYRYDPAAFVGRDAVIIGRVDSVKRRVPELRKYFRTVTVLAPIALGRGGRDEIDLEVVSATQMLKPYPALPEQPFSDP